MVQAQIINECIQALDDMHRDRQLLNLAIELASQVDSAKADQIALLVETYERTLAGDLGFLRNQLAKFKGE